MIEGWRGSPEDELEWLLLERDGRMVNELRDIQRENIHGTRDGFVYTFQDDNDATHLVHFHTQRAFSDQTIWRGEDRWFLEWVSQPEPPYGPYLPWQNLGDVTYEETPHIEPTPAPDLPLPEPILKVGMLADVQTIDGEVLYLRDAPGTDNEIVVYLYDRMVVELLEGPETVDGYVWWRIRTEDGTEGWAAEAVDDLTTLLPHHEEATE